MIRVELTTPPSPRNTDGRWYRTRLQPVVGKSHDGLRPVKNTIEGVIGLIMDVTELKARERDLEAQEREKRQLVANEAAAKEASRLKSQFLANASLIFLVFFVFSFLFEAGL